MRSKEQLCGDNQKILSTSFRHFIQLKQYTISTLGRNLKQILDVVTVPIVLKKLFETMLIFCLRMTLIAGTYYTWTQSVKMYELKTAKLNTQASRTTHYTQDGPSLCLQKKLYKKHLQCPRQQSFEGNTHICGLLKVSSQMKMKV